MGAERDRVASFGKLEDGLRDASDWYLWGPYLSERQWGTVREDYSPGGTAWDYLPHDHARSRAYRWGEDGMAGFSDIEQRLCVSLALWNGRDPILKERMFGLTGSEGNHGEDVKEYWWYLDALPSHAWNRWRYHYPQAAFPYGDLVQENARRGKLDAEYELLDTGIFDDDRYWIVEADWAKADPHDLLLTIRVTNQGPEADTIHVLPTAWYRNTWAWEHGEEKPELRADGDGRIVTEHPFLGSLELVGEGGPDLLFCENETNSERVFGSPNEFACPKDGINDHVVSGAPTVAAGAGSKAALWYRLEVPAGETATVRVRLRRTGAQSDPWQGFDDMSAARQAEADEFYAELTPEDASEDEGLVLRQALAGMLWSKQLFAYDVARWLDGDPTQPPPPESRKGGRNAKWRTFDAFDIMSMPDKWEYPWFAAWDLSFHCVSLAHVDPAFAKYQLVLLCREWFQHPNGALPAYEWSFDDVNPPVQAWAALEIFMIDGARDVDFLSRVFDKLLVNFTWWVNREDRDGSNLFEGGFLGLDNIGPIDRSHLGAGQTLEQSDGTGWMAYYSLVMAGLAIVLDRSRRRETSDLVLKFLEHFALLTDALSGHELWDEDDGFFYDRLRLADGTPVPLKVRSMVGILPMLAAVVLDEEAVENAQTLDKRASTLLDPEKRASEELIRQSPDHKRLLLGAVPLERVRRIATRLFDEAEFLSPYGLRALSSYHAEHPFVVEQLGAQVDYEPAESTTGMFGGNSNWRGPIWFPVNYLVVSALRRYGRFFGDEFTIEYPTGSARQLQVTEVAEEIRGRLVSLFLRGDDGRRPCFGWVEKLQHDPAWRDNVMFFEYFHGDNGAGLGASHQTGWTGLVADLIIRRHPPTLAELLQLHEAEARA
jgi:hypothetical protein